MSNVRNPRALYGMATYEADRLSVVVPAHTTLLSRPRHEEQDVVWPDSVTFSRPRFVGGGMVDHLGRFLQARRSPPGSVSMKLCLRSAVKVC